MRLFGRGWLVEVRRGARGKGRSEKERWSGEAEEEDQTSCVVRRSEVSRCVWYTKLSLSRYMSFVRDHHRLREVRLPRPCPKILQVQDKLSRSQKTRAINQRHPFSRASLRPENSRVRRSFARNARLEEFKGRLVECSCENRISNASFESSISKISILGWILGNIFKLWNFVRINFEKSNFEFLGSGKSFLIFEVWKLWFLEFIRDFLSTKYVDHMRRVLIIFISDVFENWQFSENII